MSTETSDAGIRLATPDDAPALLALQRRAFESEARLYNDWTIAPLTQNLTSLQEELERVYALVSTRGTDLKGSVRAHEADGVCHIARLVVCPSAQGAGLGSQLLNKIEAAFSHVERYALCTGSLSTHNIRFYQRHGYTLCGEMRHSAGVVLVQMEKQVR
ncbi:GNAT family N-acetyltransferase [Chitinibacteraceae bacterium HSL-7]